MQMLALCNQLLQSSEIQSQLLQPPLHGHANILVSLWIVRISVTKFTGEGCLPGCMFTLQHLSFVHELKDLEVTRCTEEGCSKFHCPLCPPNVFKPAFPQKVKDHLRQGHWKQRFMYRGLCPSLLLIGKMILHPISK